MELRAELTGRDGRTWPLRVRCEAEAGAGGELRGLQRGLEKLQEQVTELLAPLVQQEREAGGRGGPRGDVGEEEEEEEGDEDEDENENNIDVKANADGPPLKRTKVQQS
ncbi:EKC/KEOPS complex subunit GON7 [Dromaius novaehollandiae]|uniref:EKC/KEOPS complex subunit GON7 n=1 Tax=Dromaius novaehollandiae TaxID=8790 RepID=UPI000E1EFC81|nr:EKC/KEOPS complex subunit GON7 [Dromaius novaehollandiae]XP_025967899.1 EKC/KEOPS complex subunit GON7 [Dromaius novaehollandiae]